MPNKKKEPNKIYSGHKPSQEKPDYNDRKSANKNSRDYKDNKQQKSNMRSEGGKN